ncbi:MAG: hypothetical protein ACOC3G_06625, partial [Phycisphaeraceae bacterium]
MTQLQHDPRLRQSWRVVTLGWCAWLLVTWGLSLMKTSVVPASRWMIFVVAIGAMAIWPAFRLSQVGRGGGASEGRGSRGVSLPRMARRVVLGDWLTITVLTQMMIWPLWLSSAKVVPVGDVVVYHTRWSALQTAWLGAALAAWTLLTAATVAWGLGRNTRTAAMAAMAVCLLLLVGEPLAYAVAGAASVGETSWPAFRVSPLSTLWGLTVTKAEFRAEPWIARIASVGTAAIVAWL